MSTPRKRVPNAPRSFSPEKKIEALEQEPTKSDLFLEEVIETFSEEVIELPVVEEKKEILPPITPVADPGPRFLPKEELPVVVQETFNNSPSPVQSVIPKKRHPRNIPKFSRHNTL
jgi:hypothetical protein